jgi:hypothetical protein
VDQLTGSTGSRNGFGGVCVVAALHLYGLEEKVLLYSIGSDGLDFGQLTVVVFNFAFHLLEGHHLVLRHFCASISAVFKTLQLCTSPPAVAAIVGASFRVLAQGFRLARSPKRTLFRPGRGKVHIRVHKSLPKCAISPELEDLC